MMPTIIMTDVWENSRRGRKKTQQKNMLELLTIVLHRERESILKVLYVQLMGENYSNHGWEIENRKTVSQTPNENNP